MLNRTYIHSLFLLLLLKAVTATASMNFENWDVSILYPLPGVQNWNELISPTSAENILPYEIFDHISFLTNQDNEKTYFDMRVVGIRLDPCFVEGSGPVKCERQLRFIWQPLAVANSRTTTVDASVHVFFKFSETEFKNMIDNLSALRQEFKNEYSGLENTALAIHPLLKKLGLSSTYGRKLNALFLKAIQNKSMHKITFMKLEGVNDIWTFGGFNISNNRFSKIIIPRVNETKQGFINTLAVQPNPGKFSGGIFPAPKDYDNFNFIVNNSFDADRSREEDLKNAIRAIAKFEHPLKHNPGTLDCVTCHLSNTVRAWVFQSFSDLNLQNLFDSLKYKNSEVNLNNLSPLQSQTNMLRMFGYFDDQAIVSQRTINETAEITKFLNSL